MMMNNCRNKNKAKSRCFVLGMILAVFVVASFFVFCACGKSEPNPPVCGEKPQFIAADFYACNTVEIASAGKYGEVNIGTGLIISGEDFPIIVSNFHVAGKDGGLIWVRFSGEADFVNTNTIVNKNIVEVLAYDESLDLCIFKVDYRPLKLYNDLTQAISETEIIPFSEYAESTLAANVISLGNAAGEGIIKLEGQTVSLERIVSTEVGFLPLVQTTLAITDGCSGGPMFDTEGRFLGITSFGGGSWGEQYSFSIPSVFVYRLYQEALQKNSSGQIQKLKATVSIAGEEQQPTEISVSFTDLNFKFKLEVGKSIVFESIQYFQYSGYTVVKFGEVSVTSRFTSILAEAMKYNSVGNTLRIVLEKNGESKTLDF